MPIGTMKTKGKKSSWFDIDNFDTTSMLIKCYKVSEWFGFDIRLSTVKVRRNQVVLNLDGMHVCSLMCCLRWCWCLLCQKGFVVWLSGREVCNQLYSGTTLVVGLAKITSFIDARIFYARRRNAYVSCFFKDMSQSSRVPILLSWFNHFCRVLRTGLN